MKDFVYERPSDVASAVTMLARDGARALSGGTDLIPQLREGRRAASSIVDVKHIPALSQIERRADGGWRVGAATSVLRLGRHAAFMADHRPLVESARLIGSLQVQSRASLGGNICNAAPSADGVPLLLALGATGVIAGPAGERVVPVRDLFAGPGRSTLAPGEMLVAIELPARKPRSAAKYLRFTPRREMDIAVAGAGVSLRLDEAGTIAEAHIALASVAPTPILIPSAARQLIGARPTRAVFEAAGLDAAREARPISDTRGSADYRRELVAVLTRRAFAACASDLGLALE